MRLPSLSTGFLVFLLASIAFTGGEARLGPRSSGEDGTAMSMWRQHQRRRMLEDQGVSTEEQKKQDEKPDAEVTNSNNNNNNNNNNNDGGGPVEQKKDEPKPEVVVAAVDDQKKAEVVEPKAEDKKDEEKNTAVPPERKPEDGGLSSGAVKGDDERKEEASKREEQLLKEALVLEREENRVQQEKTDQATADGQQQQQQHQQQQQQNSVDPVAKPSPAPQSPSPPSDDRSQQPQVDSKAEVKAEVKVEAQEEKKEIEKSEPRVPAQEVEEASKPSEQKTAEHEPQEEEEKKKIEPEPEVAKVDEENSSSQEQEQERKDGEGGKSEEDAAEAMVDSADPDDDYPDFLDEFLRFPERLQESAEHLKTNVRPDWDRLSTNGKDLFNQANEQIKESFTPLIGRDYAPVVAYLVSYGLLLLPLGLVMFLFERVRAIFSLQKVLLFINIYVAAYFAALVAAAFVLGSEPMDFFRNFSPSSYIFLQLLQAFGYIMFIILQTFDLITTCSSGRIAAKLSAALQWVVVVAVGFHYYVTVFHRAMAKAKPLTSWKIYGLYSASFTILCAFARIERGKKQYIIQESGQETTKQN
ncbi:hypothetical protein MPTK1_1g08630 [Marchantia polymorpha subsp. ruderalis]|nr:hypothetical protein MARPO_0036s0106 [Marchantia polymorpha]BBM97823.1 hypothetical protein Mp_1g08630 [Marchantia polymorpha subsp. ruderalis]|eukprot:PTQ41126.1 hypothetical protein MARPO_0036s0106 [Marchantia polymorpha]